MHGYARMAPMGRSRRGFGARLLVPAAVLAMAAASVQTGHSATFLFRRCTASGLIGYASSYSGNDPYTQEGMKVTGTCVAGLGTSGLRIVTLAGTGEECFDGPWNPFSPHWPEPCYGKTM